MDYSIFGEKGFILKNETLVRFQPVGVTWDDSYCRRITDSGPSGCFVERDLFFENITGFQDNFREYNCSGKVEQDLCILLQRISEIVMLWKLLYLKVL